MTDHYGGLSSDEFEAYLEKEGIAHVFTSVHNASSNELDEVPSWSPSALAVCSCVQFGSS